MKSWIYKTEPFESLESAPINALGFIYLITHIPTGKKYIGRKLLHKTAYKQVNKKKKRIKVESDWKEYYSSSPEIHSMIELEGYDNFEREILFFCNSKAELNYAEEKLLYAIGVLESDEWFNSNIRSKMYRKWVDKFSNLNEMKDNIKRFYYW